MSITLTHERAIQLASIRSSLRKYLFQGIERLPLTNDQTAEDYVIVTVDDFPFNPTIYEYFPQWEEFFDDHSGSPYLHFRNCPYIIPLYTYEDRKDDNDQFNLWNYFDRPHQFTDASRGERWFKNFCPLKRHRVWLYEMIVERSLTVFYCSRIDIVINQFLRIFGEVFTDEKVGYQGNQRRGVVIMQREDNVGFYEVQDLPTYPELIKYLTSKPKKSIA